MSYIIARWENGEWPTRVYYTLNFDRFNHTTHVRKEALQFGSKASAESFLNSDGILNIYSNPWFILKEGRKEVSKEDKKFVVYFRLGNGDALYLCDRYIARDSYHKTRTFSSSLAKTFNSWKAANNHIDRSSGWYIRRIK